VAVYAALFGTGRIIFGQTLQGVGLLLLAVAAFAWIARSLGHEEPPGAEVPAPAVT